jgi:hypothetical protein
MAPGRPQGVLALEIKEPRRKTDIAAGDTQVDPRHEPCQSFVGAPRIHGELLKLGIDVEQTSVAKYMARRRRPPSQDWKTFIRNHADGIAAMDLFVVPTASFRLLYSLLILRHDKAPASLARYHSKPNCRVDCSTAH